MREMGLTVWIRPLLVLATTATSFDAEHNMHDWICTQLGGGIGKREGRKEGGKGKERKENWMDIDKDAGDREITLIDETSKGEQEGVRQSAKGLSSKEQEYEGAGWLISKKKEKLFPNYQSDGQIITADGNSQMYLTFGNMLKNFNIEDLKVLWSIVKARFKKTKPVNHMDNFLLLNLKTMFEHHVEDNVWKNQQGLVKVLNWKLYDSYGVHCVTIQNILYYLLVEKMYPLTNHTLHQMFNDVNLQVDYECEMDFELLRLVKKQLKEGYVPE
ncbi:hypothetical protein Tco_0750327 [Tanacetum coccineum]|uniref:Uncharacterized protein n=1 Tax=Tanacetum coccineum TaxID=301880 RepID=A0ABQ4Z2D5_9ASTR